MESYGKGEEACLWFPARGGSIKSIRVPQQRARSISRKTRSPGRPRNSEIEPGVSSRERLLDAAIELFARNGYDPVTTGAVAEAAGLTQSMVHYHFGSKAKLWEAAIGRLDLSHLPPLERLRELVRRLAEANADQPNYGRVVVEEGMIPGPRLDWLIERFMRAGYGAFDKAVEDAIAAGAIRPMPVHDVTNALTSAATLAFSLGVVIEQVYGVDMREPARIRSFTDNLLAILFDGLGAGAKPAVPPTN